MCFLVVRGKGGLGNSCIGFSSFKNIYSGTKLSSTLHLCFSKPYKLYDLHFAEEFLFKKANEIQTSSTCPYFQYKHHGTKKNKLICIIVSPFKNPCNYYRFKECSRDTLWPFLHCCFTWQIFSLGLVNLEIIPLCPSLFESSALERHCL